MQEAPPISEVTLNAAVQHHYGIVVTELNFLPIGADSSAWVYRLPNVAGTHYFLKVRKGQINQAGLAIPHYLQKHGVTQVVAPLPTRTQTLWVELNEFKLILYPFVEGSNAVDAGMSEDQWSNLGSMMQKVHASSLPPELLDIMRRETFTLNWLDIVKQLQTQINYQTFTAPLQQQLATFWQSQSHIIQRLIEGVETRAVRLQESNLPWVLCHADLHTWNVLIDERNQVLIVDWDEVVLAPKERDLMFVMRGIGKDLVKPADEAAFFQGYGSASVDALALAYYRYAWAIEDIGSFAEQVLLMPEAGEESKRFALELFQKQFDPGNIVSIALESRY
jgi:spectinomycin phosphotransferase